MSVHRYLTPVVLKVWSMDQQHHIIWEFVGNAILGPHLDLLSRKLWGGTQHSVLTSFSGD